MHGGTNPGGKPGNQNAVKHGIYASFMTDAERAVLDEIKLGEVDQELRLCRVRLMRALAAEQAAAAKQGVELAEVVSRTEDGERGITKTGERRFKRTDYVGIVDRLMGRIESLERTRAELLKNGLGDEDDVPTPVAITVEVEDASVPESPAQ
jgi:hypothetical protein